MYISKITTERKKLGLSQEELASRLKVSQKSISKYERGTRRPSYETLLEMSKLFGVSVDYLLDNNVPSITQPNEAENNYFFFFFDDMRKKTFANRIRAALADIGLTENEFISQISIENEKASTFLAGEGEPSADDLIEISQFLETSIDYLLGQVPKINYAEKKILNTFVKLNKDNQDIIIGKAKELLKEQEREPVATDTKLRKTGTDNLGK